MLLNGELLLSGVHCLAHANVERHGTDEIKRSELKTPQGMHENKSVELSASKSVKNIMWRFDGEASFASGA